MRAWATLYAKGLAMGLADLVPGVSGGTIAFISGIYDELVATIAGLDRGLLRTLRTRGLAGAWRAGNLGFLAVLLAGILTSVAGFAGVLHWLLANRPAELWAFFFGLVAASVPLVARRVADRRAGLWALAAAGTAIAAAVTSLPPLVRSDAPLVLAAAAAVAACAMILPGISGSFILLILGAYAPVIGALRAFDAVRIAAVALGVAAGSARLQPASAPPSRPAAGRHAEPPHRLSARVAERALALEGTHPRAVHTRGWPGRMAHGKPLAGDRRRDLAHRGPRPPRRGRRVGARPRRPHPSRQVAGIGGAG